MLFKMRIHQFLFLCVSIVVIKSSSFYLSKPLKSSSFQLCSTTSNEIIELSNLKTYLDVVSNSFTNEVFESLSIYSKNIPSSTTTDLVTSKYGINMNNLQSTTCRLVDLKGTKKCQFNYKYTTNEQVKNYNIPDEATSVLSDILTSGAHTLRKVVLTSKTEIVELQISTTGNFKVKTTKNGAKSKTLKSLPSVETESSIDTYSHDRSKNLFVPIDSPFLKHLKIVLDDGSTIKSGMSDKFKQIQKFVEIMDGLIQAASSSTPDVKSSPSTGVKLVDMGCGLGYLTFATHAYFSQTRPITTVGVEVRPELVSQTNSIAKELGAPFDQLSFVTGSIQSVDMQQLLGVSSTTINESQPPLKALIALHACDTATDDAILQGLQALANVIVVAPCCQKEIRSQIDRKFKIKSSTSNKPHEPSVVPEERAALQSMMSAGIHRERMTEMATDKIRALILEHEGYDARISEFVDRSHTAKNILISAVRRPIAVSAHAKETIKHEIDAIMKSFGITKHSLYDKIFNR